MRTFQSYFAAVLKGTRSDPEALLAALQGLWPHLTGQEIAAHSRPVRLRDATLFVDVESERWARELVGLESILIEKTNHFWGGRLIDRIEFRSRLSG